MLRYKNISARSIVTSILLGLVTFGTAWGVIALRDDPKVQAQDIKDLSINPGALSEDRCCLRRVHKQAKGSRSVQSWAPYACDTGQTASGFTLLRLTLGSEGAPCDQDGLIPNNSVLEARGTTRRRADGFAYFTGNFSIRNPAGAVIFEGTLELMDRLGSHHAPFGAESCNQQGHVEGWLAGRGSAGFSHNTLRAIVVANGNLPGAGASSALSGSIDGTLVKCP